MIETTDELLDLLKKLNLKVSSVAELRHLLTTINANYNPQAARLRTAKLVAIGVPCSLGGMATAFSLFLTMFLRPLSDDAFLGALALVWGCCALVSVTALIFSFALLLGGRKARVPAEAQTFGKAATMDERLAMGITPDLSL
jgi:hypothetical protein